MKVYGYLLNFSNHKLCPRKDLRICGSGRIFDFCECNLFHLERYAVICDAINQQNESEQSKNK